MQVSFSGLKSLKRQRAKRGSENLSSMKSEAWKKSISSFSLPTPTKPASSTCMNDIEM
jgi:hypothetical protein